MKFKDIIYLVIVIAIMYANFKLLPQTYAALIALGIIMLFMFTSYSIEIIIDYRRWKRTWTE